MESLNCLHNRLTRHLRENGQGYFEHARDAWTYGAKSAIASTAFFIHGILPFTFEHTGSEKINGIHQHIKNKMDKIENKPT